MSVLYRPVGWNWNKAIYDAIVIVAVVAYVLTFIHVAPLLETGAASIDDAVVRMRAFGTCAFLLLTIILSIGPLARIDRRFLPLLYNRRHLGVIACIVAVTHAMHVLNWYLAYSPTDPYLALLTSNTSFGRLAGFPFELFGVAALLVLLVQAATSHDFWLSFLTPPVWKAVHMIVYGAYASVVLHVGLGAGLASKSPALLIVVSGCAATVAGLHLWAARLGGRADAQTAPWINAGPVEAIVEGRGLVVHLSDAESIAIFRHAGRLSAIANACAHQNGPLGEGRIVDGCVTCPWHGFQYRPEDGCAPAPFTEKLATYRLKIDNGLVLVDPRPNPPGTRVEPATIGAAR